MYHNSNVPQVIQYWLDLLFAIDWIEAVSQYQYTIGIEGPSIKDVRSKGEGGCDPLCTTTDGGGDPTSPHPRTSGLQFILRCGTGRGGGVSKNLVFAGTSLMDDP